MAVKALVSVKIALISSAYSFASEKQTLHMSLDARKPVFGHLRTTKAQTSLHIRAD